MRRSTRWLRWTSILLLAVAPAFAAEQALAAGALTLDEAIAIALERNPGLAAAGAGVDAADATVDEARAPRVPKVVLSETFSRTTNPVYVFGNLLGQEAFGVENFDPDYLNQPDALSNWNTMLAVRVPVYVGGRIAAGTDAAEAARVAAEADRERARQAVVHAVTQAFTGVALADAHLAVANEAREVARENADLVRDLHDTGMVVRSDLLQAEVRLSEVDEMIARAEAATRVARAGLNAAMGRDLGTAVDAVLFDDDAQDLPVDVATLVTEALGNRPDIEAAEARAEAAERAARVERGGMLPEVGVEGRYEANAEDFVGADGSNWSLFASARWTVFEGKATSARVRRARAEADAAGRMVQVARDRAELEVRTAYHELEAAGSSLIAAERSVGLAEESLRIVRDRYQEGMTTLVELLDSENALTRARVRVVSARRDARLARAALDLAVGRQ